MGSQKAGTRVQGTERYKDLGVRGISESLSEAKGVEKLYNWDVDVLSSPRLKEEGVWLRRHEATGLQNPGSQEWAEELESLNDSIPQLVTSTLTITTATDSLPWALESQHPDFQALATRRKPSLLSGPQEKYMDTQIRTVARFWPSLLRIMHRTGQVPSKLQSNQQAVPCLAQNRCPRKASNVKEREVGRRLNTRTEKCAWEKQTQQGARENLQWKKCENQSNPGVSTDKFQKVKK